MSVRSEDVKDIPVAAFLSHVRRVETDRVFVTFDDEHYEVEAGELANRFHDGMEVILSLSIEVPEEWVQSTQVDNKTETENDSWPCPYCCGTGIGGVRDEDIGTDYDCHVCHGKGEFPTKDAMIAACVELSEIYRRSERSML